MQSEERVQSILVAVDFSEISDRVLQAAINLTNAVGAKVILLHVAPREPDIFGHQLTRKVITEPVPEDVKERYDNLMDSAKRLKDAGVAVTPLLVRGDRVRAIMREVDQGKADLIVMGAHGRGGLYKRLVGSVSEGVMREARCPVLIIPTKVLQGE